MNFSTKFKMFAIGKVAKDSNDGDWEISVYPVEIFPTASGSLTEESKTTRAATDFNGNSVNSSASVGKVMPCQWAPMSDPFLFCPPRVFQGQAVMIWTYGEGNRTSQYYWTTFFSLAALSGSDSSGNRETNNESQIRRTERRLIWLSNKSQILKTPDAVETGYYCDMDTINKLIKLHTSDNDGEATTYDFTINTSAGTIEILDGAGNYIKWDTPQNHLTISTNNELTANIQNKVTINTTDATLNCKTSIVNAEDSVTVTTKTAEVNAETSATVKTDTCTIDSKLCNIN